MPLRSPRAPADEASGRRLLAHDDHVDAQHRDGRPNSVFAHWPPGRAGSTMRACASASTPQLESPDTRLRLTPARAATRAPLSVSSRRPGWPFGKDISGRTRLSPDGTSPFLLRSVCSATSRGQYALCDCGCCDFKNDARALMEIAEMQGCAYSCSAGKAAKLSKFVRPM